jgi:hypothetical protein
MLEGRLEDRGDRRVAEQRLRPRDRLRVPPRVLGDENAAWKERVRTPPDLGAVLEERLAAGVRGSGELRRVAGEPQALQALPPGEALRLAEMQLLTQLTYPRIDAISTSATSGRLNSFGGRSPLESISRTLVPESAMCYPASSMPRVFSPNPDSPDLRCSACSGIGVRLHPERAGAVRRR